MKKKEFAICLPYRIEGDKCFIWAEDLSEAQNMASEMVKDAQEVCKHRDYINGKCVSCNLKCDHSEEITDNACVTCGAYILPSDPRCEPEWIEER